MTKETEPNPNAQLLEALTKLVLAADGKASFPQLDQVFALLQDAGEQYRPLVRAILSRIDEVDRLRSAADRDELTGVCNRRGLQAAGAREIARHRRSGEALSALVLDMDGLKAINDQHGHAAGDRAIVELSRTCEEHLRESDVLARTGGDEFVVLLPETDLEDARRVAGRLRRAFASRAFPYGALGVSIGSATLTEDRPDITTLLQDADEALYRDKRARKEARALAESGEVRRTGVVRRSRDAA
ncbi:MAG: GGDEF domain-containing protein [Myxococcota bacterium]